MAFGWDRRVQDPVHGRHVLCHRRLEVGTHGHDVNRERPVLVRGSVLKELNRGLGHNVSRVGPRHVKRRILVLLVRGIVKLVDIRFNQDCMDGGQRVSIVGPVDMGDIQALTYSSSGSSPQGTGRCKFRPCVRS